MITENMIYDLKEYIEDHLEVQLFVSHSESSYQIDKFLTDELESFELLFNFV